MSEEDKVSLEKSLEKVKEADSSEISEIQDGENEIIEGGTVEDVVEPRGNFHEVKHHAQTASILGYIVFAILGSTFLIHYIVKTILIFNGHIDAAKEFSDDFKVWLPVVSGLAGSAATYYFTKHK